VLGFPQEIVCIVLLTAPALATSQSLPPTDSLGDPLPPFASARLGTQRLRHERGAAGIAFLPDGRTIATVGRDIRIWDARTGKQIRQIPLRDAIKSIDFAADGKTLIGAGVFTQAVYLYSADTGALKRAIGKLPHGREIGMVGDREAVRAVGLSADGAIFCAPFTEERETPAKGGGTIYHTPQQWIRWFDASTGKQIHETKLELTWQAPLVCALSSDGKWLACTSGEEKIHVYDRHGTTPLWRLEGHKATALCGAFSLEGGILATGGMDKCVRLWDLKTGRQQRELTGHGGSVLAVSFLTDSRTLASLSRDRICLWNWADGGLVRELKIKHFSLVGMAMSPRGDRLAAISGDGTIIVWDVPTGLVLHPVQGHRKCVNALAFSPDGKSLVSGGDDTVLVWDLRSQMIRQRLDTTAQRLAFLAQSNCNCTSSIKLAVGKPDSTPELWQVSLQDPAASKWLRSFRGPTATEGVRLSPDGRFLAAQPRVPYNSEQKLPAAYIWDVEKGDMCATTRVPTEQPSYCYHSGLAFSPDGKLLATGGCNKPIQLSTVPDGKLVREIPESSTGLAFSPDGKLLASYNMGLTKFFDPATGQKRWSFGTGRGWGLGREWPIVFSPDGRTLALAEEDSIIRLCELSTGWQLAEFDAHQGYVYALAFSPDGTRLVSAGEDTTILVWNLTGGKAASTKAAWDALADNGLDAYAAIHCLVQSPRQTLKYVKDRMPPLHAMPPEHVGKLIADLGNARFSVREQAMRDLEVMQELAVPAMREALANKPEPEALTRLKTLLKRVDKDHLECGSERVRWIRVLEMLERMHTTEAFEIVRILASGADEMRLSIEARSVLNRWPHQPSH
jgi:WD40 repeat protein